MFAGEALHPTNFSSAHGAFASGKEQALKLIRWKKNQRNSNSLAANCSPATPISA